MKCCASLLVSIDSRPQPYPKLEKFSPSSLLLSNGMLFSATPKNCSRSRVGAFAFVPRLYSEGSYFISLAPTASSPIFLDVLTMGHCGGGQFGKAL